jgi:hypothetical protein
MRTTYKIPKSFQLLGHEFQVREVDHFGPMGLTVLGTCEQQANTITLLRTSDGMRLSPSARFHTFCHELVHAIYNTMGETDASQDERHVDMFAGLLHQALTTMKYK